MNQPVPTRKARRAKPFGTLIGLGVLTALGVLAGALSRDDEPKREEPKKPSKSTRPAGTTPKRPEGATAAPAGESGGRRKEEAQESATATATDTRAAQS